MENTLIFWTVFGKNIGRIFRFDKRCQWLLKKSFVAESPFRCRRLSLTKLV